MEPNAKAPEGAQARGGDLIPGHKWQWTQLDFCVGIKGAGRPHDKPIHSQDVVFPQVYDTDSPKDILRHTHLHSLASAMLLQRHFFYFCYACD